MRPQYNRNMDDSDIVIDIGDLFYRYWYHLPVILAVTLACALVTYVATALFIPPAYSASADMIVNNQQETNTITNSDLQASATLVGTYSVVLKSHAALEQVIHELDLPYDYETLESRISISAVDNTQVMRVTVKDESPERALEIVSAIVAAAPTAIMNAVDAGSVKTVDGPWTSGEPVSPNKTKNALVGGLLGLILCCAVILCQTLLNHTFKTTGDVRTVLDLPVLAVIPLEKKGRG